MKASFWSNVVENGRRDLVAVLDGLCTEVGAAESSILVPSGPDALRFFASTNAALMAEGAPAVPVGASFSGLAFSSGQTIALADAAGREGHFKAIDALVGRPTLEFAAVALVDRDVVGVLTLVNRGGPGDGQARPFTPAELQRLGEVAAELAGTVALLSAVGLDGGGAALSAEIVRPLLALRPGERRLVRTLAEALIENRREIHEAV